MNFLTLKNVTVLLIAITLLAGIVVGVRLVQQQTQLKSKAAEILPPAPTGLFPCNRPSQYQIGQAIGRCGSPDANGCYLTAYATYTDNTLDINGDGVADPNDPGDQPQCKASNCAEPRQCPGTTAASSTPTPSSGCSTAPPYNGVSCTVHPPGSQCASDYQWCDGGCCRFTGTAANPTPTPTSAPIPTPTPTPQPGGGQPTPTPGGPGAGPAEGSECQYEILDPTTLQRASRIETKKDYRLKLTMINKAAQDSGVVWKQGQYKLTSTPQTQATWGTKASYELSESQSPGQDVRPGGSALFQIPIKAPAIGQNPESKSFYFIMAKDGVAFGAACQPQDVIVHPPAQEPVSTLCYAISEESIEVSSVSSCDFQNPTIHPYTDNPITYSFRNTTPGLKTIHVKFFDNNNRPSNIFTKNVLLSPDPSITNADCRFAPTGIGTQITITGTNFGTQGRGKLKVAGVEVQPIKWVSNSISANVDQRLEGNVPLSVSTDDGREVTSSCTVNTTSFTFTAKNQCRLPGQHSLDNVEVKIFEAGAEPILKQTIKLDNDGKPQGFAPKLEKNKNYTMVIKGPGVLAKKVDVKATGGTVNVEPFTLLSGDIFPRGSPDGKVNALDTSELKREWSLVTDVVRDGDLNGDSRVNSIDYSCMLQNINKEDEVFSPPVITTPTPSLTPTPQPVPTT